MISQSQNKSSKRWWVIFLFIPIFISGCPIAPIVWEVALYVGGAILYQNGTYALEQVIDNLVANLFNSKEQFGYVITSRNNSLEGTYSTTMKFSSNSSGQLRDYKIDKPRMVRESTDSPWVLAPDLQQIVEQVLSK
jgi:hypothetical protein